MIKNTTGGLLFIVLLAALCVWGFTSDTLRIPLGIDLQGGTELTYRVDLLDATDVENLSTRNLAEEAKLIVSNRLDRFGLKEISISVIGKDLLLVELPGGSEEERNAVRRMVEEAGRLSIHLVSEERFQSAEMIAQYEQQQADHRAALALYAADTTGDPPREPERLVITQYASDSDGRTILDADQRPVVQRKYVVENVGDLYVDGAGLGTSTVGVAENGLPAILFEFEGPSRTAFATLTGENQGKMLAINLDGTAVQVASINQRIGGKGQISGSFTEAEARAVVNILNAGSLPARMVIENQQTIGSGLGRDSILRGVQAMAFSLAIVLGFMIFYYMAGGLVANLGLALNVLLIMACLAVFRNTLTFPGIAGLLLTVGMAVDANILIFERIREELQRGRSLPQSVTLGFQKAFSTIFDANLTTLLTAFVLFQFGTGPVKGFAVVLSIGLIMSFFTALYVTRLVLSFLIHRGWLTEFRMRQVFREPSYDFLKYKSVMIRASVAVLVIGVGVLMVRGRDALGLDFTGGTRLLVNLNQEVPTPRIRSLVDGLQDAEGRKLFADVIVQGVGDSSERGQYASFSIRTRAKMAADLSTDEEGANETDRFRALVAAELRTQQLLAPPPVTEVAVSPETGVLGATLNLFRHGDLQEEVIRKLLADGGFPVDSVRELNASTSAVSASFRVETTPLAAAGLTQDQAVSLLNEVATAAPQLKLSDEFSAVDAIGAKVAQDLQGRIFVAMMIAFAAIVFYISLRFQFKFGLAALVATAHDIFITMGVLAVADLLLGNVLSLKIDLSVMAALLTVVGYSLNDTIVVFDRIRENLEGQKRDVDYTSVINLSINQTLSRTILTSGTTFIVVAILLIWGGPPLQGFAFSMCIGVVVGTFSTMYIAGPALIHFHRRSMERRAAIMAEAAAAS